MAKCPINRTRNLQKGTLLFVVLCIALAVNQCGTAEEKPLFVQDPLSVTNDKSMEHDSKLLKIYYNTAFSTRIIIHAL